MRINQNSSEVFESEEENVSADLPSFRDEGSYANFILIKISVHQFLFVRCS